MPYLLDANVFIQGKRLHYGFDFCPGFWDWIDLENAKGQVFSIERVGDELKAGNDDLSTWAAARGKKLFLPPDTAMLAALQNVSSWVTTQSFAPPAVSTFLQVADYYLVARAVAHGDTVVTHETPANTIYKVKIPNVCIGMGVKCMTPYEMLRLERARFVLGAKP